ncbi:MAG: xylan 1,4-beta-xylosidase, partial [Lachnospiraceae bacterium]|nr:xylan 1,4-beta-xylosidase [Lachnospiraceae bacterium]
EAYSYWTFGDVFEEQGVPDSLFHGGFGMVAAGNIPKPTFWTFRFFKLLKLFGETCVHRDKTSVIVQGDTGFAGILWNINGDPLSKEISFPLEDGSEYTLVTQTVDEECCNPLKLWHDIGEPAYPTADETGLIKSGAYPLIRSEIEKGQAQPTPISFAVNKNGIVYFTLQKRSFTPDRGYDYDKVLSC